METILIDIQNAIVMGFCYIANRITWGFIVLDIIVTCIGLLFWFELQAIRKVLERAELKQEEMEI